MSEFEKKIFEFDLIDSLFLRNHMTWDGVYNEGFFNIHINIILLILLIAALVFKKIRLTNTKFIFSHLVVYNEDLILSIKLNIKRKLWI